MTWNDIAKKLTSRKLWLSVTAAVSAIMIYLKKPPETIGEMTAIITALAAVVAYVVGEGLVDAKRAGRGE